MLDAGAWQHAWGMGQREALKHSKTPKPGPATRPPQNPEYQNAKSGAELNLGAIQEQPNYIPGTPTQT